MHIKIGLLTVLLAAAMMSCKNDKITEHSPADEEPLQSYVEPKEIKEFGFNLNDYVVKRDTIRKGDSFGLILQKNQIGYPHIYNIVEKTKDSFDTRKLQIGKPYTLLCSKDSINTPECFIYQPNAEEFVVIGLKDSLYAYKSRKPITYVEKELSGIIRKNSNITQEMVDRGVSPMLAYKLADYIYAWTIDFTRLQEGDKFKVIYRDKYIDDTIYGGVYDVKAAYFEHNTKPIYAFRFQTDSIKGIVDYFDENAKNLRRAFLKSPIALQYRISSRYNLKRRIAYYGYKLRPHKGTDFAAPIGTPIMATANGTVVESTQRGGNGKYVKIKHNATYSTQYLHMKAQNVRKGQFVKQGDIIGWIGMTGNTGGPHVCYRFWKNGSQVDPFREKLPEAEPIKEDLKAKFLDFIEPIKTQLDVMHVQSLEDMLDPEEDLISQID
ncbi:peptidoglycan DD-metalloendopeptidase family protein [Aegicerativicinus sediminis]